jgi:hypothetical protein
MIRGFSNPDIRNKLKDSPHLFLSLRGRAMRRSSSKKLKMKGILKALAQDHVV